MNLGWQDLILILVPDEWPKYIKNLEEEIIHKYKLQIRTHFGIPTVFPCMVLSIIDNSSKSIEHKFFYPKDALTLIDAYQKVNNTLCRAILND